MTVIHPGSIQARVGAVLGMIELLIEQGDLLGAWKFIQLLQVYVRPYMRKHEDLLDKLNGTSHPIALSEDQAFENMLSRVDLCLETLHRENLYGYHQLGLGTSQGLYAEATN